MCTVVAELLFTMRPRQEDDEGAVSSVRADAEGLADDFAFCATVYWRSGDWPRRLRFARLARLRTNQLFDWIFGQRVVLSSSQDWWPRGCLLRVLEVLHGGNSEGRAHQQPCGRTRNDDDTTLTTRQNAWPRFPVVPGGRVFESSCERPPTDPSTPRPLQTPCADKDLVAMPVTRPPGRRLASDEEVLTNLDEL